jgi:putative ABC transport system permease protein
MKLHFQRLLLYFVMIVKHLHNWPDLWKASAENVIMLKSYFKIALRNFIKEKFYSTLNLLGLAVGLAVVLLISLFIYQQLSYDRFHTNADRIYRMATHVEIGGVSSDINATFPPYADALEHDMPEVEVATRVLERNGTVFKLKETVITEDNIYYVDADFFKVFDCKFFHGTPDAALKNPHSIILTPVLATKLFKSKSLADIIGESITINNEVYQVTGVVDEPPQNSHLKYEALASLSSLRIGRDETWNSLNVTTYVLLQDGSSINSLLSKHADFMRSHLEGYDDLRKEGIVMDPIAHTLTDIHLKANLQGEFEPSGSMTNIYIFSVVALVVLLLACVNFVNLVTARSTNRAKEVGVRKVMGSGVSSLRKLFIIESIFMVFIAMLIALGCIELLRSPFELITGIRLPFDLLIQLPYLSVLVLFIFVLGLAAGSYPAFYLSSFNPSDVLKRQLKSGQGSGKLRNVLVVVQFTISIILITCTLVVQRQLNFMKSKKLGFDKENVLIIDNGDKLESQDSYLNDIRSLPFVKMAGVATHRPVDDYDGMFVTSEDDKDHRKMINYSRVDHDFLKLMNYQVVSGRIFSQAFLSDSAAVVINEKAAAMLFNDNPLGKKIDNGIAYTVIGVVKDFNFESLKNDIKPLAFFLDPHQRYIHVRLHAGDFQQVITSLKHIWEKHSTDTPFSYSFLDETYDALYRQETQLGTLFTIFTGLALFIACLGLIGLAAYTAQQRKKEISVRKVLGASMPVIVRLLSMHFLKLVFISCVLAIPFGYFLISRWLDGFAFKTDVPVTLMVSGGVIVIVVAIAAVAYQSIRAGLTNPIDSLKQE